MLSLVFGHVPIIFPGIFRINISLYHPLLYFVLVLFQLSLSSRILGDAMANGDLRKWGAMINGISILLFFAANAAMVWTRLSHKQKRHVTPGR